ncbi:hypothetical protein BDK51DRAFT_38489, partial [Blyttiomyces helicus]
MTTQGVKRHSQMVVDRGVARGEIKEEERAVVSKKRCKVVTSDLEQQQTGDISVNIQLEMSRLLRGPVSAREFLSAMKLARCSPMEKLAVGVSGEADSIALCILLKQFADPSKIVALTVDHKLKEGSTDEALRVQRRLSELGIEHHILTVDWSKSGTGHAGDTTDPPFFPDPSAPVSAIRLQTMQRARRLNLLARAAKQFNARSLLVANQLDEQIAAGLRKMRMGSGPDALSGMRIVTPEVPTAAKAAKDVRLIRPLLMFPKERLEETCRENGVEWTDDAINPLIFEIRDSSSEILTQRRLQAIKAGKPAPGPSTASLASFMEQMERHRVAKEKKGNTLRDAPTGTCFLHIDRSASSWLRNRHLAYPVLAQVHQWAGPITETGKTNHFRLLLKTILDSLSRAPSRASVGGVYLHPPRRSQTGIDIWCVGRAMPSETPIVNIAVGETAIWDGRFYITLRASSPTSSEP